MHAGIAGIAGMAGMAGAQPRRQDDSSLVVFSSAASSAPVGSLRGALVARVALPRLRPRLPSLAGALSLSTDATAFFAASDAAANLDGVSATSFAASASSCFSRAAVLPIGVLTGAGVSSASSPKVCTSAAALAGEHTPMDVTCDQLGTDGTEGIVGIAIAGIAFRKRSSPEGGFWRHGSDPKDGTDCPSYFARQHVSKYTSTGSEAIDPCLSAVLQQRSSRRKQGGRAGRAENTARRSKSGLNFLE